jgi:hypothetical protein
MPEIFRIPTRMVCTGIDLVSPIDRVPPGGFPYLFNCRVIEEGRLDGRPGYTPYISLGSPPNSIRRLNGPLGTGFIFVGGGGFDLYAGPPTSYTIVDPGVYSGDPLALIPFRPDQSPNAWMYVFDRNKFQKVGFTPAGVVTRPIGVAPPTDAPVADLGTPASVEISDGQDVTGWVASGSATGPSLVDRIAAATTPVIGSILYNSGTTGWCVILPTLASGNLGALGNRSQVFLDESGPNEEFVTIREIHPPVAASSIAAIQYDDPVGIGACSIVLANNPAGLVRNSLVTLDVGGGSQESVRVLSVTPDATGTGYSFRCVTANPHFTGETTNSQTSWYVFTNLTHVAGEAISVSYVEGANVTAGVSTATLALPVTVDAGVANNRPVSTADDYMHLSVFLGDSTKVSSLSIKIDVDAATTGLGDAFTGNYYTWTVVPSQLSLGSGWTELVLTLASGVRSGSDLTRSFADIQAIQISAELTDASALGVDDWYIFGTYGPTVLPNSPSGISYESRFRDSTTGAHSVPGPQTRYQLFPLREEILVTPQATTEAGVDYSDIYRMGGTIPEFLYVGTVVNDPVLPQTYSDSLPDLTVLSTNIPPDLTALQPFPILGVPWSGTVDVNGTSVFRVSGTPFDVRLVFGSVILINGTAYQVFAVRSPDVLEIIASGGVQVGVPFSVASPNLAGQSLPFAFGPLEGPFAPVIFALGDPLNAGTLYWTNFSDADGASDTNSLELCSPSEPLVSGADWNGLVFAGSRENIYLVRYSFLQNPSAYQDQKIPSPSGMWSRWACCSTPFGVAFLGRDGIYIATQEGAASITDDKLYSLFPHEGQQATAVLNGSNLILPVDMSLVRFLRLAYTDGDLLFSYIDTGGNSVTLRYEMARKRWFLLVYADNMWTHYLVEGTSGDAQQLLHLSRTTNNVWLSGGNTDAGAPINSIVLTPSMDSGDERTQKLYVDSMTQVDGVGTIELAAAFDNAQSFSPVVPLVCTGSIQQVLQNLASLSDLTLHRNIGAKFAWTGGPDGPKLLAWEPSGYPMPYLSKSLVTQFFGFSFSGWKSLRRLFPGMISNSPVLFTVKCQDGRTFGPYTIPSTSGTFRIMPIMLDQNIKDLAFALSLDGQGQSFAMFPDEFHAEVKEWSEATYIRLALWKA